MYISLSSGGQARRSLNVHKAIFEKCFWLQCLTESENTLVANQQWGGVSYTDRKKRAFYLSAQDGY